MSLRSVHYSVARLLRRRRSMSFTSSRSNPVMTGPFRSSKATPKGKVSWSRSHPTWRHAAVARRSFWIRQTDDSRTHFQAARIAVPDSRSSLLPRLTATGRQWSIFPPCPDCLAEYASPADRRFHAQNIACARCGPGLWLEDAGGPPRTVDRAGNDAAVLARAGEWIRSGKIVAVKGIGGFHLLCDATSNDVVNLLRSSSGEKANRWRCYLPIVASSSGMCFFDNVEWAALSGPVAPIVVLNRRPESTLAEGISPGLATVGTFLAYTLLHRELARLVDRPIVATSANASDEPMPIDNDVARVSLAEVADHFLMNDRPIVRHADDSVVRVIGGRTVPIRVGRGLAPVRLAVPRRLAAAFGGGRPSQIGDCLVQGPGDSLGPAHRRPGNIRGPQALSRDHRRLLPAPRCHARANRLRPPSRLLYDSVCP